MAPAAKTRTTSNRVATSIGCAPLKAAYELAIKRNPRSWEDVEDGFLRAMEAFDANIASGAANMGDLQNGKGDFFNDLLALLLENCAGVTLFSRGQVPGLIFPKHKLDVTFPSTGTVEFMLEAKAVGTPKHPGSPGENDIGRPGSADLDKRVKEIGFKAIDLKLEFARRMGTASGMTGDLVAWLKSAKPKSYVFIAARVINEKDADRVAYFANLTSQVSDGVGVFCFMPVSPDKPTTYKPVAVQPHIQLARVLFRACEALTAAKSAQPAEP